jgi:hypothetical protein
MLRRNQDEENWDLEQISSISKSRKVLHNEEDRDDGDKDGLRHFSTTTIRTFSHHDYTIGWICALPLEMAAAKAILDEIHTNLEKQPNDHNTYTSEHNIVVACLPLGVYGTTSTATVAS